MPPPTVVLSFITIISNDSPLQRSLAFIAMHREARAWLRLMMKHVIAYAESSRLQLQELVNRRCWPIESYMSVSQSTTSRPFAYDKLR